MMSPSVARRVIPTLVLVAIVSAHASRARADDFDVPPTSTTPTPITPRTPPPTTATTPHTTPTTPVAPPSVDAPVPDAAASRVVRVVVTRDIAFADPPTLACARGRIAVGTSASTTGLVLPDGVRVVVANLLVEGATAIAVHVPGETVARAAIVSGSDRGAGLALLQLVTPLPATAAAPEALPGIDDGMTALSRAADGTLAREPSRLLTRLDDELGIDLSVSNLNEARVLFRSGRAVGLYVGAFSPTLRRPQVWTIAAIHRIFAGNFASPPAAPPAELTGAIERAARMITALSTIAAPADRCRLLASFRTESEAPDPTSVVDAGRTDLRILLAAYAWNRLVSATDASGATAEPAPRSAAFGWVDLAYRNDATASSRSRFASELHTLEARLAEEARVAEEARLAREHAAELARADAERIAEAARLAQERRDRRAATYYTGLAGAFARDGDGGLGGAMVTGGVFGSLPRLASTGSLRAALAIGTSVALGGNGGFTGLLTLDLGATIRFGGARGGFVLLAYSPGFVSSVLPGSSPFVYSSYRVAAGVALQRRVLFVGYRVLAPAEDYPLHLLELGVAFRHGPPAPRTEAPSETARARAGEHASLDAEASE